MSRPTSKNFKEQDNEGKVGKKAEEWKDGKTVVYFISK